MLNIQRFIKCPNCSKSKFIDIDHSTGRNSVKCEKCHRFIILNWDNLSAEVASAIKVS